MNREPIETITRRPTVYRGQIRRVAGLPVPSKIACYVKRGESHLNRRLQGPAMCVVEGFVQEKDLGNLQTQQAQLAAQLLEGVRAEPAGDEGADVFRTKLH